MKEGRETERQQKKQCRQSKPWTEIGKQWKTRQDKRRNTTGDCQVDIPKTSTSYFCVKTNGNRNRVGLNWWGGQFPWIRWVCEGWYHTNSTSASQNTSWGQHREEQPHRSLWKAALAPGRSSSRGQVPPALQAQGWNKGNSEHSLCSLGAKKIGVNKEHSPGIRGVEWKSWVAIACEIQKLRAVHKL